MRKTPEILLLAAVSVVGMVSTILVDGSAAAAVAVSTAILLLGASLINYLNDNKFRPFV